MRIVKGAWIALLLFIVGVATTAASASADGRWKVAGDGSCYFDETDNGLEQCSPNVGRWKVAGDGSCYFDETDSGPDQCAPAEGTSTEAAVEGLESDPSTSGLTMDSPRESRHSVGHTREIEPARMT